MYKDSEVKECGRNSKQWRRGVKVMQLGRWARPKVMACYNMLGRLDFIPGGWAPGQ